MSHKPRKVTEIIEPQYVVEGADVLLRRSFGPSRDNPFDPFLLFDHFAFNNPIEGPIVGFPTHPHRGIETVTYMLEGNVRHRDSLGNTGVIGPGAVQWMTSGRGILHEELPKRGPSGRVNGFQLWVNLPAALKMSPPRYQEFTAGEIVEVQQPSLKTRLVAGNFADQTGLTTDIAAQPLYMDVTLEPDSEFHHDIPSEHTTIAYVFEGEGLFGVDDSGSGEFVPAVRMVVLGDGDSLRVQTGANKHVRFMLIAGKPFHEPIVPYGPFVMNTEAEIRQVFEDIRNGTFAKEPV
ncbi:MAG: pirin family protein [Anaerolineales bacterium]